MNSQATVFLQRLLNAATDSVIDMEPESEVDTLNAISAGATRETAVIAGELQAALQDLDMRFFDSEVAEVREDVTNLEDWADEVDDLQEEHGKQIDELYELDGLQNEINQRLMTMVFELAGRVEMLESKVNFRPGTQVIAQPRAVRVPPSRSMSYAYDFNTVEVKIGSKGIPPFSDFLRDNASPRLREALCLPAPIPFASKLRHGDPVFGVVVGKPTLQLGAPKELKRLCADNPRPRPRPTCGVAVSFSEAQADMEAHPDTVYERTEAPHFKYRFHAGKFESKGVNIYNPGFTNAGSTDFDSTRSVGYTYARVDTSKPLPTTRPAIGKTVSGLVAARDMKDHPGARYQLGANGFTYFHNGKRFVMESLFGDSTLDCQTFNAHDESGLIGYEATRQADR